MCYHVRVEALFNVNLGSVQSTLSCLMRYTDMFNVKHLTFVFSHVQSKVQLIKRLSCLTRNFKRAFYYS